MDVISYESIISNLSQYELDELRFPKSFKEFKWISYLSRSLSDSESNILQNFAQERMFNKSIEALHGNCLINNLRVASLTNMHGNCLFESLMYHGIGTDIKSFRKGLASLLYFYKDVKNFIPNTDMTLNEMFVMGNEIEYVCRYHNSEKIYYKYSYNIMCQDLSNADSWTKLPTEFILRVISYIYKKKIVIVGSNSDYLHIIDSHPESESNIIYLGHLGESHYVAVGAIMSEADYKPVYYNEAKLKFIKWARKMEENVVRRYYRRKMCPQFYDEDPLFNSYDHIGNFNTNFSCPQLFDNSHDISFF